MNEKITILGAGISGLSVGWRLLDRGNAPSVTLLENSEKIGGMCGSFNYKGSILDYGPHKFYSQLKGVMPLYKALLGNECLTIKKKNSIRLLGKYFSFPPNPIQLIFGIGMWKIFKIGNSFAFSILKSPFNKKVRNYKDYFITGFGEEAYNLIFRDLAQKTWGNPEELSAELGKRRVPVPNIFSLIANTLGGAKNKPDVSAEYFYYPKKGFTAFPEELSKRIEKKKGTILTKATPTKITVKRNKIVSVTYKKNNKAYTIKTDYLVSTIPLPDLVNLFSPKLPEEIETAVANLKYRSLIVLYLFSKKDRIIKDNWYFYPEKEFIFNRVSELDSFSPYLLPNGNSCIMVELTCDQTDNSCQLSHEKLLSLVIPDLEKAGVLKREDIVDSISIKKDKAYPVYDLHFKENLDRLLAYLSKIENFFTIGRHGLFNYNNADHCIDMGVKTADFILAKSPKTKFKELINYFDTYRIVD